MSLPKQRPALQVTGHLIKPCRFAVLRDDEVHGWLGASPDGLIDSLSAHPGFAVLNLVTVPCFCSVDTAVPVIYLLVPTHKTACLGTAWSGSKALSVASPGALAAGMGPGVLEIKCPFNRGQPESASVPSLPPWYYMPQVCLHRRRGTLARHSLVPVHLPACTQGGSRLLRCHNTS